MADLDPARAVADTVASKARMGVGAQEEFELQQPLFRLHTYTAEQVTGCLPAVSVKQQLS